MLWIFQVFHYCYLSAERFFKKLLPEENHFYRALYTFDIGQNDLTAGYKLNLTIEQVKAYVPDLLEQFSNVIKVRRQNWPFKLTVCSIYESAN